MDVNMQIALGSINLLLGAIIPPMGIKIISMVLILFSTVNIESRPISYSGGSTLMLLSNSLSDSIYYHYSPTYKYSMGVEFVKNKPLINEYVNFRFTYLLNRNNTPNSQRNLYMQSGVSSNGLDNFFYGIHGDWETRRLFAGFGIKKTEDKALNYKEEFLQLGFAPYVGAYGDLHTWLMIKTKKNSATDTSTTYPVIKFFKGNALFEVGYNNSSEWDVHLMYRL